MQSKHSTDATALIGQTISRLLFHYWTADDHPAMRQAQIEDWLEDLIEFGPADVAEACREWRQDTTQATRRPTPTDIRRLCVRRQYHRWQDEQRKLPPPPPEPELPPASEEDKEYVDRAVQAILRLCRLPKGDE